MASATERKMRERFHLLAFCLKELNLSSQLIYQGASTREALPAGNAMSYGPAFGMNGSEETLRSGNWTVCGCETFWLALCCPFIILTHTTWPTPCQEHFSDRDVTWLFCGSVYDFPRQEGKPGIFPNNLAPGARAKAQWIRHLSYNVVDPSLIPSIP